MAKCSSYFQHGLKFLCYGTKEMEECSCGGDTSKCNFYPEKRAPEKIDVEFIRKQLPEEVLYAQLAEEASELAQAALKMYRILDGRNPPRCRLSEARADLLEEIADVINCLQMLSVSPNPLDYQETILQKIKRWANHLREYL